MSETPTVMDFMETIEEMYQEDEAKLSVLGSVEQIGLDDITKDNVSLKIYRSIPFDNNGSVHMEIIDIFPAGKNGRVNLNEPLNHDMQFVVTVQYKVLVGIDTSDVNADLADIKKKMVAYFRNAGMAKSLKDIHLTDENDVEIVLLNEGVLPIDTIKSPTDAIQQIDKMSKAVFSVAGKINSIIA